MEILKNTLPSWKDFTSNLNDGDQNIHDFLIMEEQTRSLYENNETLFGTNNDALPSPSKHGGAFEMPAFWIVNGAFVLVCFVVIIWCTRFNGYRSFMEWVEGSGQQSSDLEYAQRLRDRRMREEESRKDTPEARRRKLTRCFQRCQNKMVLKEEDFRQDGSNCTDIETGSVSSNATPEHVCLQLNNGPTKTRLVPNCCAVCLCAYEPGDTIVWSYNSECPHAFHDECLIDW
eukprot:CAMPEP_0195295552 /NCGR_PEP_ID=MMETSP0707-20130614/17618_1 /TAXON_ID=33640 /ORGANISM="Asterionellopsis glacialis, Strain CCMP134" /LENGTH=230 /DNA_ID=CAMNT_0040356801 /DNA_START=41 /DNA_END=730 /DNA_ORIENTATION=-